MVIFVMRYYSVTVAVAIVLVTKIYAKWFYKRHLTICHF